MWVYEFRGDKVAAVDMSEVVAVKGEWSHGVFRLEVVLRNGEKMFFERGMAEDFWKRILSLNEEAK